VPPRTLLPAALLGLGLILAACAAPKPLVVPSAFVRGNIVARGVVSDVRTSSPGAAAETNVTNNMALRSACVVRTGRDSAVTLIFANAATVTLGAQTEIVVETFTMIPGTFSINPEETTEEPTSSVTRITLVQGEISGRVPKLHPVTGSSFVLHTPAGDKEYDGTTFAFKAPAP
jgi:hypothetical protein